MDSGVAVTEKTTVEPLKEMLQGEGIPKVIVNRVEDYLTNGRPGLDGRLETGFWEGDPANRTKDIGCRDGLCGYASPFTLEVVEEMNKTGICRLAGCVVEALQLNKVIPEELDQRFRKHGFAIVVDREQERWWIVDTTLNQFVEKTDDARLRMAGSDLDIGEDNGDITSKVARSLLKNGYVEMTCENLAAYITLMAKYTVDTNYTEMVSQSLLDRTDFKLNDLIDRCLAERYMKVGDWSSSLNSINACEHFN
jgi:hypothetical protein